MPDLNCYLTQARPFLLVLLASLLLIGCGGRGDSDDIDPPPTGDFELQIDATDLEITEGAENDLLVPLSLLRTNGHSASVELTIAGAGPADAAFFEGGFTRSAFTPENDTTEAILRLNIADTPLLPEQRRFLIVATDGDAVDQISFTVDVNPVDAPDVYLLVGQSNMIGFSGDGTRQAYEGGPDETNPRILQLNVSKNDQFTIFTEYEDFIERDSNIVEPAIVTAEDPLHIPLDPNNTTGKDLEYIGLGLSFAKAALINTSRNIVLVPAAWSGSAFCDNTDDPPGQWNATPTSDPELGNTWMFERAVARTNIALDETGGILRGILWHQGESDANDRCAGSYQANMESLIEGLRQSIQTDQRGDIARQADSNIPFVVGTMSRGVDERGDLSEFLSPKQSIDDVHKLLPSMATHVSLSNNDDLVPANGFPCGNTNCIHFGAQALREMGNRYYEAMIRATNQ